ncbi:tetratricopeptide repeat protein [Ovoidimarina sediminis]|uniref:tetratricopeptide repeat protein n=1 Tax=Ovoidimarina sediminis TaxID=3079856 RepID=UPI00290720E8|nr:tetratricopeptide repeat protein [Rhodophyticola sp. MJ-SS7]MDU8944916.1 tetratricopeptide repeat protein [Rhodophyticola sp. MJ-SS7]
MRQLLPILLLSAAPAFADCPPVADRGAELTALFDAARVAETEAEGRALNQQMWEIWFDAPDEAAQALLERGSSMGRAANFLGAIETYDRLVDYCPHYAEGWNQRAFMYFLSGAFEEAERDLEQALAREPRHIGALTGLGLTLIQLGREEEAQIWIRKAVALNPWISERFLLTEAPEQDL